MAGKVDVRLSINGHDHSVRVEPRKTLADTIRDDCRQTGTHVGCEHGICGACTVIVDGEAVFSCLLPVAALRDRKVVTIEGLGTVQEPNLLQQAFIDEQAAQCGYCIAGMVMRAQALLDRNAAATDPEIRAWMEPNLCRCGTHLRILKAIRRARDALTAAARSAQETSR